MQGNAINSIVCHHCELKLWLDLLALTTGNHDRKKEDSSSVIYGVQWATLIMAF